MVKASSLDHADWVYVSLERAFQGVGEGQQSVETSDGATCGDRESGPTTTPPWKRGTRSSPAAYTWQAADSGVSFWLRRSRKLGGLV